MGTKPIENRPRPTAEDFRTGYYGRRYRSRFWRRRGDHPILYRTLVRTLKPWHNGRLLDVGCGEGQLLRRSLGSFESHGVDISEEGVENTRRATGLETVQLASVEALPFREGSFDVVTCLDVVEHLVHPEVGVAELYRVLAKDGCLVLSTPNPESLGSRTKGKASHVFRDSTHVAVRSMAAWRRLLRETGFTILQDGSDTPWDVPYWRRFVRLQWIVFIALSQAMWALRLVYPWRLGENYVCIAVKR